jgi:hypothetical protein
LIRDRRRTPDRFLSLLRLLHREIHLQKEHAVQLGDLPKFRDFGYIARVMRVNAAALGALAPAPAVPPNISAPSTCGFIVFADWFRLPVSNNFIIISATSSYDPPNRNYSL